MFRPILRIIERILAPLPGWLFLLSGLAIVGLALLVPTWMEWRELKYRLDLMRVQTEQMVKQRDSFSQFNEALASDDPVLLEQLAYHHLRLKREGVTPMAPATLGAAITPVMNRLRPNGGTPDRPLIIPALAGRPVAPAALSIEDMLERPLPTPGVDYPNYEPVQSRLVRITTGRLRMPLVAAGLLAIVAGLYMPTPPRPGVFEDDNAADDDMIEGELDDEVTEEAHEASADDAVIQGEIDHADTDTEAVATKAAAGEVVAAGDGQVAEARVADVEPDTEPPFDPVVDARKKSVA
ncbi:MAG: hypothetical protein NTW19_12285 [Planctomycetota bacterium]|nr:hypothetical protein [Planctomycetota bacterium]